MREKEIDEILRQAAASSPAPDQALIERVSQSIGASLQPVRPLPPRWVLAIGLMTCCAALAVAGALALGPHGIQGMTPVDIALLFPALAIFLWLAADASVAEMIPGSRRYLLAPIATVAVCLALMIVYLIAFHDFGTRNFVAQGIRCLVAGLVEAIPAALAAWWILHRGFAVNSVAAAIAQGTLAGLAGVGMLELHCPDFEAPHRLLWHTAVVPLSALLAVLLAQAAHRVHR